MMNWFFKILFFIILILPISVFAQSKFIETSDISVGNNHVCALTSLGVKCFGNAEKTILKTPKIGNNYRQIQAGNRFSCMIVDEGVRCWGEIPNISSTEILLDAKSILKPKLLSVGYEHACAVSINNTIKCWGRNDYGEANPPLNLNNITEISLGMNNSCVIADGVVHCWGISIEGTIDVPTNLVNPRNITSGRWHHCAQTDNGINCWGYPYKTFKPVDDVTIKEIKSGGFYNCSIIPLGVKCWDETGKSILVEESLGATKLSVGFFNACAVTANKGVICWKLGSVNKGQYKLLKSFVPSGGVDNVEYVSAGHSSTCAYGSEGTFKCWGFNPDGVLDVPNIIQKSISQLSVGSHKSCVISQSLLSCWGDIDSSYNTPRNLGNVSMVSSGGNHVCAGTEEKINCWGENIRGALDVPKNLSMISQVSSGLTHVCAVSNQEVVCWGGEGLITHINPANKIVNPRAICAGGTFSCAVSETGQTQCWGDKIQFVGDSKLPTKMTNKVLIIPDVVKNSNVVEISCGLSHACAIFAGKIKCWGDAEYLPSRLLAPVIKNPRKLTAGWNHNCALGDNGLSCWGDMVNLDMPNYSLEK